MIHTPHENVYDQDDEPDDAAAGAISFHVIHGCGSKGGIFSERGCERDRSQIELEYE